MVNSSAVVAKMNAYLSGQCDLNSFRGWVVRAQIEMEDEEGRVEADRGAAWLLAEIEGRYAELTRELVSEAQWKKRLEELGRPHQASTQSSASTLLFVFPHPVKASSKATQLSPGHRPVCA